LRLAGLPADGSHDGAEAARPHWATPCCTQFPNASKSLVVPKAPRACRSGRRRVGTSRLRRRGDAGKHKAINANRLARRARNCGAFRLAPSRWSGFVSIPSAVRPFS